jgi:hypothetical protein
MGLLSSYSDWLLAGRPRGRSSIPGRSRLALGAHRASYPMGTRDDFPGDKAQGCETDHSPPSGAEVKNGRAIPPLPHMCSWRGNNSTLLLLQGSVSERLRLCVLSAWESVTREPLVSHLSCKLNGSNKSGWENVWKIRQNIKKRWEGPDWDGWKIQRMIYEKWKWRDAGEREIREKNVKEAKVPSWRTTDMKSMHASKT